MRYALIFLALFGTLAAQASSVQRFTRDIKTPTQAMLEHQTWAAPMVATTNAILTTNAGPTSAAALVVSTLTAQPDYPRNITITPTGTTGDVESCDILLTGTNIFGNALTETIHINADQSARAVGTKAFKTITSVTFPANCESGSFGATWIIGAGGSLGIKRCLNQAGDAAFSVFDSAYESTRGVTTADTDEVEKNVFVPNGTMNAAKQVDLYFVQSYGCAP